jgi:predicted XRE-type DNA-binding protein
MKRDEIGHVAGSSNVFADLGLPEPEEALAKAEMVRQIASIITQRGWTQGESARILRTTQPKVSDLLRGRLAGFSMERLIRFLNALDRDVQIVVSEKPRATNRGHLWVAEKAAAPRRAIRV